MASARAPSLWCDGSDQSEAPGVTNDQSETAPPPACLSNNGVDSGLDKREERERERTKP